MKLVVLKVDKSNIHVYYDRVSTTMYQEYVSTYKEAILKSLYIEHLTQHILKHTYVLVWRQGVGGKERLLGYFSISSSNLLQPTIRFICDLCDRLTKTYYLFDVYVFPAFRGKGIGKYLVKKAIDIAYSTHQAKRLLLYTLKEERLSRFYQKNSFITIGSTTIDGTQMVVLERKCI